MTANAEMSERKKAERVKYAPLAGGQTLRRKKPCCHWFAARYTLSIFLFCGFFMLYSLRVNLSVAIVAMVNGTAVIGNTSSSRDCPALDGSVYNVTTDLENRGEFSWDENVQGMVLGSFFYGYVLTQIPGGRLAELLGAKWLLGGGILVTSVLTLLTPSAARWSPAALMALRFLEGICEGVVFPSAAALLSHWVPVHERSRMLSFNMIGTSMGTVVTLPLTALLCGSQLFGGWPSVFYFFGELPCSFLLIFSPYLSIISNKYSSCDLSTLRGLGLCQSICGRLKSAPRLVPWRRLLSSRSVWALGVTMFCGNWGFYLLLIDLPNYLRGILHFPISSNGYQNAMVHIASATSMVACAPVADLLRKHKVFKVTTIRKLFQTVGLLGPALCLGMVPFVGCSHLLAMTFLVMGMTLYGFTVGGQTPVALDIAPDFAGTVMGIVNCMGNLSGMLAPLVTGFFIEHDESLVQWKKLFLLSSAIYTFGALSFLMFGSAKLEDWGALPTEKSSIVSFRHPDSGSSDDEEDFRTAAEMHLM
ncbi:unnamed protein product [Ixodes pacificus]